MLSIILYGRNDAHGYNYHKRLALSLNGLAELLSYESDEIVFVDFKTPEDMPTALEAISDTLTEKAKKVIKILRVRGGKTGSQTVLSSEALCRNIGIRHSSPQNEWILSTNIDMLFVPVNPSETLSSLTADLKEGFYLLPRFELPENLWERHFSRTDLAAAFSFLRRDAKRLHLNTVVRRPGFISYDNPGDFQLMTREAIFAIHGFNEEMNQGWHVDTNLCKRMDLLYGKPGDSLEKELWGYHCNHTRQETPAHKQYAPENSWKRFVTDVKTPFLKEQEKTWGLSFAHIETIWLKDSSYPMLSHAAKDLEEMVINQETFNTLTYETHRIFPHLADHFYHLPPKSKVVYVGFNKVLLDAIKERLEEEAHVVAYETSSNVFDEAEMIIFDFGLDHKQIDHAPVTPKHPKYAELRRQFKSLMYLFLKLTEREKQKGRQTKIIGINVLFTDFRALFQHHLNLRKTTYLTGISFGYVKQKTKVKKKMSKKKQLKFFCMYLLVRHFYSLTDHVRQNRLIKKVLHK